MSNHIDKIEVKVEGFSKELAVQSFELVVAVNTIPVISLNVLPIEKPSTGTGQYTTASAPDIQEITSLYSDLLSKAVMLNETATIKLRHITPSDSEIPEEKNQNIELKGWILSDVGLSTVSAIDAPILTVTFSHPVIKLDRTGTIYENVENSLKLADIYRNTGGSEIISYMDSIYEKYSIGTEVVFTNLADVGNGGPDSRFKTKVQQFRSDLSAYNPGKYIEGKTQKLFLEEVKPALQGDIKAATGPVVAPRAFCKTTWNRLISEICPTFLTTIIPTYDKEKLQLEPLSPWQNCSYAIDTKIVSSLDVVSMDPNPLIGTASIKSVWDEDAVIAGSLRQYASSHEDHSYAFYFPDRAVEEDIPGEIINLGESEFIENIATADEAANAVAGLNGNEGEDLEEAGNHLDAKDREKLNEAYAKAMFLINYRKNCKASVITVPLFKSGGSSTIYPGRVMTVKDPSAGLNLFYGYITRIITKGGSEGGCVSIFELAYARSAYENSSINKTLVEEGTENPCYPENIARL